jgi:hypothetical protein
VAEKSARAREISAIAAAKTGLFLKNAGSVSAQVLGRAAKWSAERAGDAKESAAEWSARRLERRAAESRARAERQRAAHRQAELAAAAARAMDQHRERETAQRETRRATQQQPALSQKPASQQRDSWPIWRNAFAAAACLAAIGIFLIAGGKQTKASPSVTSEVEKPAVIAPAPVSPAQTIKPAAKPVAAKAQQKPAAPSARKHNARAASDGDDFQEVTVRHYPSNLPSTPAKKDPKGVVQISDME